MTMTVLRSCLSLLKVSGGEPSVTTHPGFSAMSRGLPAGALGDLRVTVRAFPRWSVPVNLSFLPGDSSEPSRGSFSVLFGTLRENQMSITASGDGLSSSEDEDSVGRPGTDGHAFPGHRGYRAGGVHTTQSRNLTAE